MADIKLKGNPIHTVGNLPKVGDTAPSFNLTKVDLKDVTNKDFAGKKMVLNIFPSIDTAVCATSVRKFNAEASKFANTVVLCISTDMPFALGRFCGAEGLKDVIPVSELRKREFGESYGVRIADGPMAGLFSRAVVIVDEKGKVIYAEQVPEITHEPDYARALEKLS